MRVRNKVNLQVFTTVLVHLIQLRQCSRVNKLLHMMLVEPVDCGFRAGMTGFKRNRYTVRQLSSVIDRDNRATNTAGIPVFEFLLRLYTAGIGFIFRVCVKIGFIYIIFLGICDFTTTGFQLVNLLQSLRYESKFLIVSQQVIVVPKLSVGEIYELRIVSCKCRGNNVRQSGHENGSWIRRSVVSGTTIERNKVLCKLLWCHLPGFQGLKPVSDELLKLITGPWNEQAGGSHLGCKLIKSIGYTGSLCNRLLQGIYLLRRIIQSITICRVDNPDGDVI